MNDNITVIDKDGEVVLVIAKDKVIVKDGYNVLNDVGVENNPAECQLKDISTDDLVEELTQRSGVIAHILNDDTTMNFYVNNKNLLLLEVRS